MEEIAEKIALGVLTKDIEVEEDHHVTIKKKAQLRNGITVEVKAVGITNQLKVAFSHPHLGGDNQHFSYEEIKDLIEFLRAGLYVWEQTHD